MKRIILFFMVTFTFLAIQNSNATPLRNVETTEVVQILDSLNNNPIGVWDYTVSGAGSKYEKGLLFIRKENDAFVVEVQLSYGMLSGQDVEIEDDNVKFNIIVEGTERVSVVLKVVDATISGNSYSRHGTFKILGNKRLPE